MLPARRVSNALRIHSLTHSPSSVLHESARRATIFSRQSSFRTVPDAEVQRALWGEIVRQECGLEMIASENYVSPAVMALAGSPFTNKYAEGLPGKRYYGGCENADVVENLARERAKRLFGCEGVNVQPHAGSQANMGVYMAVCKPGDTVMGLSLDAGGHLTHGYKASFSGQIYNAVSYGLHPETELIDYDEVDRLAHEHRPKLIVVGGSAYSRNIDYARFRAVCDAVDARMMVDIAHPAGLIATGICPTPVGIADYVTTTTHKTLRGPRGGMVMFKNEFGKDLNSRIFPGIQGGPLVHVIAAKAVAFGEALDPSFAVYARNVVRNAQMLSEVLIRGGLRIVSGGTDTHLMLVDLRAKGITGKVAESALHAAGITVNKNTIPNDPQKPTVTSGIRIGTPALTTRGMGEAQMLQVGTWILEVLERPDDTGFQGSVRRGVRELCGEFPIYPELLRNVPADMIPRD